MASKKYFSKLNVVDDVVYAEGKITKSGVKAGGSGDNAYAHLSITIVNRKKTMENLAGKIGAEVKTSSNDGNDYNYLNITVFGQKAEYAAKLSAGTPIQVMGKVVCNEYNGNKTLNLNANMLNVLYSGNKDNDTTAANTATTPTATTTDDTIEEIDLDGISVDDIPF